MAKPMAITVTIVASGVPLHYSLPIDSEAQDLADKWLRKLLPTDVGVLLGYPTGAALRRADEFRSGDKIDLLRGATLKSRRMAGPFSGKTMESAILTFI
jgi:hypothetical protein